MYPDPAALDKTDSFNWTFNPLTLRSDLNATSPYNSNQLFCKQVMRANNLISWRASFWNNFIFSRLIYREKYGSKLEEISSGPWELEGQSKHKKVDKGHNALIKNYPDQNFGLQYSFFWLITNVSKTCML